LYEPYKRIFAVIYTMFTVIMTLLGFKLLPEFLSTIDPSTIPPAITGYTFVLILLWIGVLLSLFGDEID
jgi:hypothetical protein